MTHTFSYTLDNTVPLFKFPLLKFQPSKVKFMCHFFHKAYPEFLQLNYSHALPLSLSHLNVFTSLIAPVKYLWHQPNTILYCYVYFCFPYKHITPQHITLGMCHSERVLSTYMCDAEWTQWEEQVCRNESKYTDGDECHRKLRKNKRSGA